MTPYQKAVVSSLGRIGGFSHKFIAKTTNTPLWAVRRCLYSQGILITDWRNGRVLEAQIMVRNVKKKERRTRAKSKVA